MKHQNAQGRSVHNISAFSNDTSLQSCCGVVTWAQLPHVHLTKCATQHGGQFWRVRDLYLLPPQPVLAPTLPSRHGILMCNVFLVPYRLKYKLSTSPNKQQSMAMAEDKQLFHPETVCLHMAFKSSLRGMFKCNLT